MMEFVPFDLNIHKEIFIKMNEELITWISNQLKKNYQINATSIIGQEISEYVAEHIQDFSNLKPPKGIIYLLKVEGSINGMGALKKLNRNVGEIKRMYVRPSFRGKGYGRQLLSKLLEKGKEFGCSTFRLETSKFMKAAQHIYITNGFIEREEYPEVETPIMLRQYQIFMEKAYH